jgi:hypothetical protein
MFELARVGILWPARPAGAHIFITSFLTATFPLPYCKVAEEEDVCYKDVLRRKIPTLSASEPIIRKQKKRRKRKNLLLKDRKVNNLIWA